MHPGVDQRARGKGAHSARIRSLVVVEDAFVVLGRPEGQCAMAVADDEERHFRTGQALLDHESAAGPAEPVVAHRVGDGRVGLGQGLGDDDPFARGQAVRLEHDGQSETAIADRGARRLGRVAGHESGSRHAVAGHESLGEGLAGLEPGGGSRRTEQQQSLAREGIGHPDAERQLRADDGEVDALTAGQVDHRGGAGEVDGDRGGEGGGAWVPWTAQDCTYAGLLSQPSHQRVLAGTAA